MNIKQDNYLPSVQELNNLALGDFGLWVMKARRDLPKRIVERDPLTHLRKRISEIVADETLTEVKKEEKVIIEIERFDQIVSQSQL